VQSAHSLRRLSILDGWRGMAIILVLLGHFISLPFFNAGRLGVELFFVLSGRLMGELLFVRREKLSRFYWRRFSRIAPALYSYIAILASLSLFAGLHFGVTEKTLFAASTFTYNYLFQLPGYGDANFDHLWSLCIEEHSYIVLSLVALLLAYFHNNHTKAPYSRMPWIVCIVLALLCMVHGIWLTLTTGGGYYDVYWRTDTRAGAILLGCAFHCLMQERPQYFTWMNARTLILLLVMALSLSLYPVSDCIKYTLGTTLLALCMANIEKLPDFAQKFLASRPMVYAGMASFSLYLYQQPFFHSDVSAHFPLPMLAAAVIAGLLSYHLIEKPARKTLNDLFSRRTGKQAQPNTPDESSSPNKLGNLREAKS
jgi:peptidoglycan/LPS O-acetylase OafA/YrhL